MGDHERCVRLRDNLVNHALMVAYGDPVMAAASMAQFHRTAGFPPGIHWVLVDGTWPIEAKNTRMMLDLLARSVGAEFLTTPNMGETRNFNYALSRFNMAPGDLLLKYDEDSWPVTPGWYQAMVDIMAARPSIGCLALGHEYALRTSNRKHRKEVIAGHKVRIYEEVEVWMVSIWRASVLDEGFLSKGTHYGFVEHAMFEQMRKKGMELAICEDIIERPHPIPHPEAYTKWKFSHAIEKTFAGTFEEYYAQWTGK